MRETELYGPVREYLVAQGFAVQGEVKDCDLAAVRGEDLVVVELKRGLSVDLLVQACRRQRATDSVYVAVPRPRRMTRARRRGMLHLLRRLELGLILVNLEADPPSVEVPCHPLPYRRRRNPEGRRAILREIGGRSEEYNRGGSPGGPAFTAYKEKALVIAVCLGRHGPLSPQGLRELGCDPKTQGIVYRNHHGWFERLDRGLYGLSPAGRGALEEHAGLAERLAGGLGESPIER